ncbi:unnamed protein product, partial [marine sediment metagenome]
MPCAIAATRISEDVFPAKIISLMESVISKNSVMAFQRVLDNGGKSIAQDVVQEYNSTMRRNC